MEAIVRPRLVSLRVVPVLLRNALLSFVEDRCTRMAAAISYYALFSLFPLVLATTAVFGVVLRNEELQGRVVEAVVAALPIEAPTVAEQLRALADLGPTLSIVSVVAALWTSSAVASGVRSSLDVVFDVTGGRPFLRAKAFDYVVVVSAGALFLTSTVATTAWRIVQSRTERLAVVGDELAWFWGLGGLLIPAVVTFLTFLLLYRALPHRATRVAYVWPGALFAAVMFELAKGGFAIYVANFARYQVVYGSLGGVIALLFWIYVSANILLFGAEVAAEYGHLQRGEPRHGRLRTRGERADWRASLIAMLRGLVFAPPDEAIEETEERSSGPSQSR